jgi:hypothetical protein
MGVWLVHRTPFGSLITPDIMHCIANYCGGDDDGSGDDDSEGDGWRDSNAFKERLQFDDAGPGGDEGTNWSEVYYDRAKWIGTKVPDAVTDLVKAKEPMCHWCEINPSAVADHEPSLELRWRNGDFDGMTRDEMRAAANDPDKMVGSCASCNKSKGPRQVGTGRWQWDPRTSPVNSRERGGPSVLPWIW